MPVLRSVALFAVAAVDGFRPTRSDVLGAVICLAGVEVIMYGPAADT
ncbi:MULTISPECIES: hypothetical protein [unclassified Kitasatospora]